MSGITYFRCTKCTKELDKHNRDHAEKYNGLCPNCRYLEIIGVETIADYNNWLRGTYPAPIEERS